MFCRAGPTSTDQVAGSCGRSRSDSLGHEHGYLSLPPFQTSVAAGQTHISHSVSGPWAYVPTWILAAAALPGPYGIVRGITLWPDLHTLPRRRAWLGWTQLALTVAFVAVCLFVAWPKA